MSLIIRDLRKSYGNVPALQGCSLDVADVELMSLVGPSGCAKSTLLNIVAGFLPPDSGDIEILGLRINELPVRERNIAFIMERLGLYAHLSVFENIAYPLRVRRVAPAEIRRRVQLVCEIIGVAGLDRKSTRLNSSHSQ